MDIVFKCLLASRGKKPFGLIQGKDKNCLLKRNQSRSYSCQQTCSCRMFKSKGKLITDVVEHVPQEILALFIFFLLTVKFLRLLSAEAGK